MTVKYVEVFFSFRTFYHTMQKKTTLNFKNIYIFCFRLVGTFCANCTVTGYPCFLIRPFEKLGEILFFFLAKLDTTNIHWNESSDVSF